MTLNAQIRPGDDEPTGLDEHILKLTSLDTGISPAARIALQGAVGVDDIAHMQDIVRGIEVIAPHSISPIDKMRSQGLNEWEYAAALRFRGDFDIVHRGSAGVANYDKMGMYDTALARQHARGNKGGMSAGRQHTAHSVADTKIDAMERRGALLKRAGPTSFFLAEAVIGFELWPKHIAAHLGETQQYIGRRFKEALHDLAGFYRLYARGPRTGQMRSWHAPPSND